MHWPSFLATLLVSFEVCSASTASSPTKSPQKSSASTPVKLDLNLLRNLNDFSASFAQSPLKVTDSDTKHLALDFDDLAKDKSFPSKLFFPKTENIFEEVSWKVPLHRAQNIKSIMNLEGKLADIQANIKNELIDDATSLSWISDGSRLSNYVVVVSTTISQLSYLISRLSVTSDCPVENAKRIRAAVSEHLKTLVDFCDDIKVYSGRVGMTFEKGKLKDPTKYFENLFILRDQKELEMSDEMFQIFIDFFFDAYATEFSEEIIDCYLGYVESDRWAPLPITFLRDRMVLENPEQAAKLISAWRLKSCSGNKFDSRHLVNLGYLMQQGFLNQSSFMAFTDLAKVSFHQSQYTFRKEMIKFLTLMASTPWLLPSDPETALLIGDYSSPTFKWPFVDEADKIELIKFTWKFFAGSADFAKIEQEEYENICKLIQRLDFAYPGISESLWSELNAIETVDKTFIKGSDFQEMVELKIKLYESNIESLTDKAEFLKLNFSNDRTVENFLADSKTLMILFDFFTNVFIETMEEFSEGSFVSVPREIQQILDACIDFFDTFLTKFAHKSIINHWYEKYEFIPTRIFDALNELWMISGDGFSRLSTEGCLIWENINKLVDNNVKYAQHFMTILRSKTLKHRKAAFSAKISTPKCLIRSGDSDQLNLEFLTVILSVSDEVPQEFFAALNEKLVKGEISFSSADVLFQEILSKPNFNVNSTGYSQFWDPFLNIYLTRITDESEQTTIKSVFKKYLQLNRDGSHTTSLTVINCSIFMSFNQFIVAEVLESPLGIESDVPESLASPEDANRMFDCFSRIIIDGISLKDATKIFSKLVKIARTLESVDSLHFSGAFNCLLLSIMRLPQFVIPDEEKTVLILHKFYSNFSSPIPYFNESFLRVLRKSSSVVAIYEKLISKCDPLPTSAFDFPALNDKRTIQKIQQNYMRMVGSNPENMSAFNLNPIAQWIKLGKVDASAFIKLLGRIQPGQTRIALNFLPLIVEFINCEHYSVEVRVKALSTIFSEVNNEIIRCMANHRYTIMHESFMELIARGSKEVIYKFLEDCTDADWYEGLMIESERYRRLTFEDGDITSSNLFLRDREYSSELQAILHASVPDYGLRTDIVHESDAFVAKMSDTLPILRESLANGPFADCLFHLTSINLQMSDGASFFNIYAKPETFLNMLRLQEMLFKTSPRRKSVLTWLLDSVRVGETRMAFSKMIPELISVDNFVLVRNTLRVIEKWFSASGDMEKFMEVIVTKVFASIFDNLTVERVPVLDEMFCAIIDGIQANISVLSSNIDVHVQILEGLNELKIEKRSFIENSTNLMKYLKILAENFAENHELMLNMIYLLKDLPIFYLKNKMEWIIIWKLLKQNYPIEFIGSKALKVCYKLGNNKSSDWKPLYNLIPAAKLPAKVLVNLIVEISAAKPQELEVLSILPEKLEITDFANYSELERLLKFITIILESFEIEEEEVPVEIYSKLFVLLDIESRLGMVRTWTWRRILRLTNLDVEKELVVYNRLLEDFPMMLEQTTSAKIEDLLTFFYELNSFESRISTRFDQMLSKALEIYDKQSGTISQVFENEKSQIFDFLEEKIKTLDYVSVDLHDNLAVNIATLKEFKYILSVVNCTERNDRYAEDSLTFILKLAKKIFNKNVKELNKNLLAEFSDLIVELIHKVVEAGNVISFAKVTEAMDLEALISSVSYHVTEKVDEFRFIVNEMMKFASTSVADMFFLQISESDLRVDVCFFTKEIIGKFTDVTQEGFDTIADENWPALYLTGLIKADRSLTIDWDHYEQFEGLLGEIEEDIDYQNVLRKFGRLTERQNDLVNVLSFVERLLERKYFTLDEFYENFMIDSVVRNVLKCPSDTLAILKSLQKRNPEIFNRWTLTLESETQRNLTKTLQSDANAAKVSLHTTLATGMLRRIEGFGENFGVEAIESVLKSFKNLEIKIVETSAVLTLGNVLVDRLSAVAGSGDEKVIQEAVKFSVNFPSFEAETFDKLMEIAVRVFSEDILVILVEKSENREALKSILNTFATKIDFVHLKTIKTRLQRFGLFDDREILQVAARNSEPSQVIELLSSLKNLTSVEKLNLLENCRVISGVERIGKLINYYKSFISNHPETKIIGLKAMLSNRSVLMSFMAERSKGNLRNKAAVLGLLRAHLERSKIVSLADEMDSPIVKIIVNLYFKASSSNDSIIPQDFDDLQSLKELFSSYLFEIQNDQVTKNKAPMYLKSFRFYNEIESRLSREELLSAEIFPESVLNSMAEGLAASIDQKGIFVPSPQTVYAVYKLTRRLSSKKKERYLIMRKMLFTSTKSLRTDCFEAVLRAQVDSGNIDWEFHQEILDKTKKHQRIQALLHQFTEEHR